MEKVIEIKNEFASLETLKNFLAKQSDYACSLVYDTWDMRTAANGQMEQCLLLQKSGMHGVKLYFTNENMAKVSYIIPNKIMHAYFGKSVKARRTIIQIAAGALMQGVLSGAQQKAFGELETIVKKAAV